ncbi:MAG: hypothetical protein KDA24_15740 [Deltaproteobacteria bacterium]|nr:hypothetical protein [Deltaproteobacteria bacterium]
MSSPPVKQTSTLSLLTIFAGLLCVLFASSATAATVTTFPGETDTDEPETTSEHGESSARVHKKKRRTVLGDLNSRWFHVGGGGGMVVDPYTAQARPAGRFVLGGGAYTIGLYGGGGVEVTGSALTTPSLSGVGYFGVAIPVPVVHPLVGVRGHVGLHAKEDTLRTTGIGVVAGHVGAGLQTGFIIREFDGRPGIRLMVDAGAEYRPDDGKVRPDFFVTLAAVF